MKKYIYLYILAFVPYLLFSQINPLIEFESYTPNWQHITIDSTSISDDSDGMDRFVHPKYILQDSNVYIVSMFGYQDKGGAFLEKLNTNTGKVLWKNYYDRRNNDDNIETMSNIYINGDGNIEILSFRQIEKSILGYKNKFSKWQYDLNDGELIEHSFIKVEDTTSPVLVNSYFYQKGFLFPLENIGYSYLSSSDLNGDDPTIDIYNYILDNKGKEIKNSFIKLEKKFNNNVDGGYFNRIKGDSILAIRVNLNTHNSDSDTAKAVYYFELFDKYMNHLISRELEELEFNLSDYSGVYDVFTFDDVFVLNLFDDIVKETRYYFFDYKGKFIGSYFLDIPGIGLIRTITKLKDGRFLIVGSTNIRKANKNDQLYFFIIDLAGQMKVLKKYTINPVHHYLETENVFELDNGDIVLGGRHKYNQFLASGTFYKLHGRFQTWMCFKAEDLGLKTSITELPIESTLYNLYPNPTSDILNVEFFDNIEGIIEIYDEIGRMLISVKTNKSKILTINVSELPQGIYIVKLNSNNKYLFSSTFVKE